MKNDIITYIKTWEKRCYNAGIAECVPDRLSVLNKVPSYKEIALSILNNKKMSYPESHYYYHIKKVELENRDNSKQKQLCLMF